MNINNKYMIDKIINKGSFGTVAKGYKIRDKKPIVIKFDKSGVNLLKHESFILNYLYSKRVQNIPSVIYYGIYKESPILVLPFYNYNLDQFITNNHDLSTNFAITFIQKLIHIIQNVHSNLVIHRDIKPENIMIHNNEPILIDFGLSSFYFSHDGQHIQNNPISKIVGSYKYCSIHVNKLNSPTRRDDLISISYILILLLFKQLPWDNIKQSDYINRKSIDYINILCDYHEKSDILKNFFKYIYNIEFDSIPSYDFIYSTFDNILL